MRFIDPRIDFAFKKIFGSEDAKDVLISFLESLLGLEGDRRIAELTILDPFMAPRIKELKSTILDVRCKDHRGISYIVEMQIEKVSAFLKRIQYNSAKAYVQQIGKGEDYPKLNQVIAVTITDFVLFNGFDHCLSRHESRETMTGQSHLQDILHYFIELPKFTKDLDACNDIFDQWIYFIKYAGSIEEIPPKMNIAPIRHAFEKARVANMTPDELELYDKAGIAITDARGRVELAREEGEQIGIQIGEQRGIQIGEQRGIQIGEQRGEQRGKAEMLLDQLQERFDLVPDWVRSKLAQADLDTLKSWSKKIFHAEKIEDIFQ
ncbi:MAG: Rpn family recombination-promoting nuclease/putative transposase [Magnetococcales bacterium]|nr:Rpn family recombination-promoting nuclease/putative transposase [Magnetococcales bacterium]NGZ25577.1 Rpn family recombination-promoting nuclease/putative transposase [Magnetococcales bacterium]